MRRAGSCGVSVTRTSPYDQCPACAKKHIVKAWSRFNEFAYTDDNRDIMRRQFRLPADHLIYECRRTALKARDLAVMLEEFRDGEFMTEWDELLVAVMHDFYADHPEVAARKHLRGTTE